MRRKRNDHRAALEKKKNTPLGVFFFLERLMGVEPTYAAWEAAVLPMNYSREFLKTRVIIADLFKICKMKNTALA